MRGVVVVADAGYPATLTRTLIEELQWASVFAMPRTRKFTNGTYVLTVRPNLELNRRGAKLWV